LYSLQIIIRRMKSRRVRWAGHVVWMEKRGMQLDYSWEGQKEREPLGRPRHR
jgi:hypothetical protein